MLFVSTIILFDFRIVPTMCYFLFFISFYIFDHLLISFLRLVNDDMFTFPGFTSRSLFVLIKVCVLIVPFVFMLYLYYLLFFVPLMLVLSTIIPKLLVESTVIMNESVTLLLPSSSEN